MQSFHYSRSLPSRRAVSALGLLALVCVLVSTQTGCLGILSNLIHAAGGDKIPAAYEGLEDSRVAIVTVTENSQFSNDVSARILGRNVTQWLSQEVDDIEIVREDKISNWRDTHAWDQVDFSELGRGVDADQVLAIEVSNLKLREGANLYRGSADVQITVFDAKSGNSLFTKRIEEFQYPKMGGQYSEETSESRFRKLYLGILAKRVSRQFYPFDATDDYALDSISAR